MALETKTPPQPIYRIGRQPDAWRPPDWSRASADGTFGNRFDDPESYYRVLYASSQEVSCFIETLARYRPDLTLLAELEAIEGDNDFFPLGTVPAEEAHATRTHFHHDGPVWQCFDGSQAQSQSACRATTLEKNGCQRDSFRSINKGNCEPVSLIGQLWTVATSAQLPVTL